MWTGWITLALASSCALAALAEHSDTENTLLASQEARLAASMAIYRDAVVRYAHGAPAFTGRVQDAQLAMPDWYAPPEQGLWSNYVRADGLIAVYATRLPQVDFAEEMAALAHGSALAGRANPAGARIEPAAQADGGAAVALPAIPGVTLAQGAPVWLAHRH